MGPRLPGKIADTFNDVVASNQSRSFVKKQRVHNVLSGVNRTGAPKERKATAGWPWLERGCHSWRTA